MEIDVSEAFAREALATLESLKSWYSAQEQDNFSYLNIYLGIDLDPRLLMPSHSSPCLNRPFGRPLFQAAQVESKP